MRISDIYLVIGQLSSVIDESVQFYWDIISQGTLAEGAILQFRRIPTKILCLDCDQPYQPPEGKLACPNCGGANLRIIAGDEFFVEAIDVDIGEGPDINPAGAKS